MVPLLGNSYQRGGSATLPQWATRMIAPQRMVKQQEEQQQQVQQVGVDKHAGSRGVGFRISNNR